MSVNSFAAGKHAFSLLEDSSLSETQRYLFDKLGNQIWFLKAERCDINENDVLKVSIENVYQMKLLSNLWSCNAEIELQVMDPSGETLTKTMEHCFNSRSRRLDFGELSVRDYISPENEYAKYESYLFVVNIKIKKLAGIRQIRLSNFASSQELDPPNSEVILVVGGQKLYVDKCGLMGCSSVFYEMFRKDINMKTLEIQDVSVANFLSFIRLIYKQEQKITHENVKILLELAVRYDVAFLIEECVQCLVATKRISGSEKLRLAELYKLSALEEDALKRQQAFLEDTVKVLEPVKEHAAAQLKVYEDAKKELKEVDHELERLVGDAEKKLELVKFLQTAKPFGPREQELFSAIQSSSDLNPNTPLPTIYNYNSIWRDVSNTHEYPLYKHVIHGAYFKEIIGSVLKSVKQPHYLTSSFPQFVQILQSSQAHEMIRIISKTIDNDEATKNVTMSAK